MEIKSTKSYQVWEVVVEYEGRNYTRKFINGMAEWRNNDIDVAMPLPLYDELEKEYQESIYKTKN